MKSYSAGVKFALLILVCFLLTGVGYTIHDYAANDDLSPLVWVGLCAVLIGLLLWLGRPGAPDGGFVLLPLLLALGATASCARAPKRAAIHFPEPRMVTDSAGWTGPERAVTARR